MKIDAGNLWQSAQARDFYNAAIVLDDAFGGFSMTSEIRAEALNLGYKTK